MSLAERGDITLKETALNFWLVVCTIHAQRNIGSLRIFLKFK
jgi:hypothetical protein